MEKKRIEKLISFHEGALNQYRQYISPSAQVLEEETVKALRELHTIVMSWEEQTKIINEAKELLKRGNNKT